MTTGAMTIHIMPSGIVQLGKEVLSPEQLENIKAAPSKLYLNARRPYNIQLKTHCPLYEVGMLQGYDVNCVQSVDWGIPHYRAERINSWLFELVYEPSHTTDVYNGLAEKMGTMKVCAQYTPKFRLDGRIQAWAKTQPDEGEAEKRCYAALRAFVRKPCFDTLKIVPSKEVRDWVSALGAAFVHCALHEVYPALTKH